MSTTDTRGNAAAATTNVGTVDMKLEVIVIPVSDVERAKQFYEGLGWRLDGDFRTDTSRGLQFTPKGSWCSIQFGTNVTTSPPGSAQGLHLIVDDIEAARAELVAHGVDATEVYHCESGYACRFPGNDPPVPGPHPDRGTYGSFVSFSDPDGNGWILQEVTTRFPGRVEGDTSYTSATDLARAMKRAAAALEKQGGGSGQADANWADRYAEFMVREQAGEELPA
jgi:catechol 2,3-dioxygenase-like lactoylglutathione lyase family enzyme